MIKILIISLLFIYLTQGESFELSNDNKTLTIKENIQFNKNNIYEWSSFSQIIENIKFSSDVTFIPESSFSNFINLKTIIIGKNIKTIELNSFYN